MHDQLARHADRLGVVLDGFDGTVWNPSRFTSNPAGAAGNASVSSGASTIGAWPRPPRPWGAAAGAAGVVAWAAAETPGADDWAAIRPEAAAMVNDATPRKARTTARERVRVAFTGVSLMEAGV